MPDLLRQVGLRSNPPLDGSVELNKKTGLEIKTQIDGHNLERNTVWVGGLRPPPSTALVRTHRQGRSATGGRKGGEEERSQGKEGTPPSGREGRETKSGLLM